MQEQIQEGYFDVTSAMSERSVAGWRSGQWAHKVTMSTFVPWLQAKFAELGRGVEPEEIDEFVASTKDTDLDVPLTIAEIKERFKGKKKLSDIPRTRLADQWIYEQKLGGLPAKKHYRMEKETLQLAERLGRQLVLQQVKNIFTKIEEELKLEASGPDISVPEYKAGESIPCTFRSCGNPLHPNRKTLTRNGQVLFHDAGPLKGQPKRVGSFAAITGADGVVEVQSFCRDHVQLALQAGISTYPYEDAEKMAEASNKPLRDLQIMKKMAEQCPATAARLRNKNVRDTRDGARLNHRR